MTRQRSPEEARRLALLMVAGFAMIHAAGWAITGEFFGGLLAIGCAGLLSGLWSIVSIILRETR